MQIINVILLPVDIVGAQPGLLLACGPFVADIQIPSDELKVLPCLGYLLDAKCCCVHVFFTLPGSSMIVHGGLRCLLKT
jgi:hypothetical protein